MDGASVEERAALTSLSMFLIRVFFSSEKKPLRTNSMWTAVKINPQIMASVPLAPAETIH